MNQSITPTVTSEPVVSKLDDKAMFDALVLKATADELTNAEREWLQRYASNNRAAQFDLALLEALPDALQLGELSVHSRVGIDSVMRRVSMKGTMSSRWLDSIRDWLGGTVSAKAFAGACALGVVQLGVMGVLLQRAGSDVTEHEQFRAARGSLVTHAVVRVSFRDKVTEQDMRYLLVNSGARIVAGPTQLGNYYLSVRKGQESDLAKALQASPLVSSLQADVALPED